MSLKLSPRKLSPRQSPILFTNIPEVDINILLQLPDDSLESACTINKYAASLCDENFWHQRFIQTFGVTLGNYKHPNYLYKNIYKEYVSLSLDEILLDASEAGFLPLVKELLNRGADIHTENDRALILAIEEGHLEVVKLLLDRGADIHSEDDKPLTTAIENKQIEIIKLLLDRGVDINSGEALKTAAGRGNTEVVKFLLDRGADIHAKNDYALLWASGNGHVDTVKLLLDYGADIHVGEDRPLQLAAEYGFVKVVKLLIDRGANVNAPQGGDYALRISSARGHVEVVKLLLDHGADVNAVDEYDKSALLEAASYGHLDVVKLLLDYGADIHANRRALELAVNYEHFKVVKLLLDHGANITILEQELSRPSLNKNIKKKLKKIIEDHKSKKTSSLTVPIIFPPVARSIDIVIPNMAELREIIRRNDSTIKLGGKGITREYLYNLAKEKGWL